MTGFDERVIAGMSHLANGDIDAAKRLAQEIGALPPEESTPLSRAKFFEFVGNLALINGQASDALDAYRFMIRYEERGGESRGGVGNSWGKIGEAYVQLGHYDEAIEAFERGVGMMEDGAMAPEFIATLNFQLAEALLTKEEFRRSAEEFRRTIVRAQAMPDPGSMAFLHQRLAVALEPLALVEHAVGQMAAVMAELSELGISPEGLEDTLAGFVPPDIPFTSQTIDAYTAAMRYISEAEDEKRMVEILKDFGKFCREIDKADMALELLSQAVQSVDLTEDTGQDPADLLHELGVTFLRAGKPEDAIASLDAALKMYDGMNLESPWTALLLADAHSQAGEHEVAIGFLNRAQPRLGQNTDALATMANVFEAAGELRAAQETRQILAQLENEL